MTSEDVHNQLASFFEFRVIIKFTFNLGVRERLKVQILDIITTK